MKTTGNLISSTAKFPAGIIHDLIYEMMKSTAGGTSDIHSRPLTYGFQSLQDLDLICAVFCILCAHVIPPVLVCPDVFENSFLQNHSISILQKAILKPAPEVSFIPVK